jgi:hypothetical protein
MVNAIQRASNAFTAGLPPALLSCVLACGGSDSQVKPSAAATDVAMDSDPSGPATTQATTAAPQITPDADRQLHAMSDYLAQLPRFTVKTKGSIEVVLKDGQKKDFPFSSTVRLRRPDRLRSDRTGELTKLSFFYDGDKFTLFGKKNGFYAEADAPGTIDEAIDAARERFDLEAPAADLLMSDVYAVLTEDAVSGFRAGTAVIDGTPCDHLAFRGNEVDWQIWIETGKQPLPRRFVITSKNVEGSPQFTVNLSHWDTKTELPDDVFEFHPPATAQKIEFLPRARERKSS